MTEWLLPFLCGLGASIISAWGVGGGTLLLLVMTLFLGVDQRLAVFLLRASEEAGSPEIKITHEQIAQQISSAREVVARMLKRFSTQGLVEVRRGSVRLLDKGGLEALTQ